VRQRQGKQALRVLIGLAMVVAWAVPVTAQQPPNEDLRRELDSLRETLQAIQKDVQEIKGMLARQAPAPSGIGVVIDYGNSPAKGERTAKLTLVEFSDYQ